MSHPIYPNRRNRFQKFTDAIRRPFVNPMDRIEDSYGIMKRVGGFQPLFNIRDLEQRRSEMRDTLSQIHDLEHGDIIERLIASPANSGMLSELKALQPKINYHTKRKAVDLAYKMFFEIGSPWYRGLDNPRLSGKVSDFLQLYNEVSNLPAFLPDLYMCAMQLLHVSFNSIDVTNTPGYVMQSTPIIAPTNVPRIDLGGNQQQGGQSSDSTPVSRSKKERL